MDQSISVFNRMYYIAWRFRQIVNVAKHFSFSAAINVNLKSPVLKSARSNAPHMQERKFGSVRVSPFEPLKQFLLIRNEAMKGKC